VNKNLILFSSLSSLLILFITVPIAFSVVIGVEYLGDIFGDVEAVRALVLSFEAGVVASLLVALTGTPLAYLLSRWRTTLTRVVESLLEIPLALPHSVAGIIILLAYNSRSSLGSVLARFGMVVEDSFWGIVFAMAFVSAPIFVSAVRAGFDSIDKEIEYVARTLGASPLQTFLKITLPLNFRHLIAGFILALARSVSEVGAVLIVAYYPKVASTLIVERFLAYGLKPALSLTVVMIFVSLAIFSALKVVLKG